jgi:hypothetical protein
LYKIDAPNRFVYSKITKKCRYPSLTDLEVGTPAVTGPLPTAIANITSLPSHIHPHSQHAFAPHT